MSKIRDEYYKDQFNIDKKDNYIKELQHNNKQNIIIIKEYSLIIDNLEQQKAELIEALKGFCNRVENGEVRSVNTYKKFLDLLKKYSGE